MNHSSCTGFSVPYLLLRRGAKLFGLLGGDGGRHVERHHQLVVAELLVELELGDEGVGEGDDGLDAVLQLTVAEVLQKLAHLGKKKQKTEHRGVVCRCLRLLVHCLKISARFKCKMYLFSIFM